MRRSSLAALSALAFVLYSSLWLAAAVAETPAGAAAAAETATGEADAKAGEDADTPNNPGKLFAAEFSQEPGATLEAPQPPARRLDLAAEEPELDLQFPLSSSRRTWSSNRLGRASSAEPALFFAENPQPLFGLPGKEEEPVEWFKLNGATNVTPGFTHRSIVEENFFADNWGIHPATPVPTPTPRSGLLIDPMVLPVGGRGPSAKAEKDDLAIDDNVFNAPKWETPSATAKFELCPADTPAELELGHSDAAKVILELIETLGHSVLDGTVFQKPSAADEQWLKELDANQVSPREALIQYIRALEAQERKSCQAQCPATPDLPVVKTVEPFHEVISLSAEEIEIGIDEEELDDDDEEDEEDEVETLRSESEELEALANRLERRNNYLRADQVRDLANQLRFDARRTQLGQVEPPMSIDDLSMPVGHPLPMYGPMAPPMMQPSHGMLTPSYGPFMPSAIMPGSMMPGHMLPSIAPTPQPTFERPQKDVHELEHQIQALREELSRTRQRLGDHEKTPLR